VVSQEIFQKSTNQKHEIPVAALPVSAHLATWFQRRRFKKIGQAETKIAYGDHVC
jgi:N-acetylglutamate synthase-like GNAT family acetyltransferase